MLPSFSLFGFFDVYTLPIFLFLGLFFGGFTFYRLLHASARYNEFEIFDALIWSTLGGGVVGRLFHICTHFTDFTTNWWSWLDILDHPGISIFATILAAGFFFHRYLVFLKITDLELLDYWVRGVCVSLITYHFGLILDGSGFGYLTYSWLALPLANTTLHLLPSPLIALIFFVIVFFFLAYLEKNYRTYNWYRGSRSQAKTGFVFFSFWLIYMLFSLISLIYTPPLYHAGNLALDGFFYLLVIIADFILVWAYAFTKPHLKTKKVARFKKR